MITITVRPTLTNEKAVKFGGDDPEAFRACVAELKTLPAYLRRYDPTTRHWYIAAEAYGHLEDFLATARVFHNADVRREDKSKRTHHQSRERQPGTPRTPPGDPYQTLHLLPSAPLEVVKAAYRALAVLTHPDHGGDVAEMQRINAAYERLSQLAA